MHNRKHPKLTTIPLECQRIIHSFLGLRRHTVLRRVCREWQRIPYDGILYLSEDELDHIDPEHVRSSYFRIAVSHALKISKLSRFRITRLDVTCYDSDEDWARDVVQVRSLNSLHVTGAVTNADLKQLTTLPLTNLNIGHSELTALNLSIVRAFPIRHLCMSCDGLVRGSLRQLCGTSITDLELTGCINLIDNGIEHLASLPLSRLGVMYDASPSDRDFAALAKLPLETLDLTFCRVTDTTLASVSKCKSLQSLILFFSEKITDAGLAHLSHLKIRKLDLGRCRKITDAGLLTISELPITSLRIVNATRITDKGIFHLRTLPIKDLVIAGLKCGYIRRK